MPLIFRRRPRLGGLGFQAGLFGGGALGLYWAGSSLASSGPLAADPLSAWFVLLILAVGVPASGYGVRYLASERGHGSRAGAHGLFAVLLVALVGVATATSVGSFLIAWEVMAVSAYLLVIFECDKVESRRAGLVYLIVTHVSTLALILMFSIWSGAAPNASFAALGAAAPHLGPRLPWVLWLSLIGFCIKAGAVPVHFWLPGAHAAAPSHVSAMMSGVMIKTGIYGLLRTAQLLGVVPPWWGWLLVLLGVASGLLGVLWALAQHDLKRLLAYHSVENIGIILIGVGTGALGVSYGRPSVALLGFAGALLHTLNHGLFKSLLFLGAGVVSRAAGTLAIDRLGGLARSAPRTAAAFLLGSAAISGLPPLNGFVSEWVVARGLLTAAGGQASPRGAVVVIAGLGLIGGLAVACFTKVNGTIFLGHPRDGAVRYGPDPEPGMLAPMLALAAACVLLGALPMLGVVPATKVAELVSGYPDSGVVGSGIEGVTRLAIGVLALGIIGWAFSRWLVRRQSVAEAATWACGAVGLTARAQYTASSYADPLLTAVGPATGLRIVRQPRALSTHPTDVVLDGIARPIWNRVLSLGSRARMLQTGRLRWYLLYVVLTVSALLVYLGTKVRQP
ncbi:MAG: proton-conducting transporter membrane subunit [Gemmatimonadota bacterium]